MKPDKLSQTAAFVAIKFYGLTQIDTYRSLFDEPVINFYDKMIQTLPAPLSYYHYWLKLGWVRSLYIQSEELLLPGDLMHIIARKWYIQQMLNEFINNSYEQIVVLGAGFDHLATYYQARGFRCFEIDTPYMSQLKTTFLGQNYPKDQHPGIIKAHFPSDSLGTTLDHQDDINPNKKTVIIAEGFFDYLDQKTVNSSLNSIRNYFDHPLGLITTHFALDELSAFHRNIFRSSVALVGEQLKFNAGLSDFQKMLTNNGFSIEQRYNSKQIQNELSATIQTSLPVLNGFYILSGKFDTTK